MTIVFISGMIYYTATCVNIMLRRSQILNQSLKSTFNPEDLGLVNINQTGMNFYVIV